MFGRLFSEAGLSLDRLRALVEVGSYGSIIRAAEGDPARQSQYSRQIKELEDFFRVPLTERHGKGLRLTGAGKELARISRFFLLGLSNFQRGCLEEGQSYRIGSGATFAAACLTPALAGQRESCRKVRCRVEVVSEQEAERRLHDLTLDFAIVARSDLSRPLQSQPLGHSQIRIWIPRQISRTLAEARQLWASWKLPLVWPTRELSLAQAGWPAEHEPELDCASFMEARSAILQGRLAGPLPEILRLESSEADYHLLDLPSLPRVEYRLAWNPRLLRLNPQASAWRETLAQMLIASLNAVAVPAGPVPAQAREGAGVPRKSPSRLGPATFRSPPARAKAVQDKAGM